MKGRKRQPTAKLKLRGTLQPCRRPKDEPVFVATIPEIPTFLSAVGRKQWRKIAKKLHSQRVLTEIDGHALAMVCQAWADWQEALGDLAELPEGIVKGTNQYNRLISIRNSSFDRYAKMLLEFGMTPSSRARVSSAPASDENPFAKFLGNKNVG